MLDVSGYSVELDWTQPECKGAPVTAYHIRVEPQPRDDSDGGLERQESKYAPRPFQFLVRAKEAGDCKARTISGLTPGTRYAVRIKSVNQVQPPPRPSSPTSVVHALSRRCPEICIRSSHHQRRGSGGWRDCGCVWDRRQIGKSAWSDPVQCQTMPTSCNGRPEKPTVINRTSTSITLKWLEGKTLLCHPRFRQCLGR